MRSRLVIGLLVVIVLALAWVGFRLAEPQKPSATYKPDTAEVTEGVRHLSGGRPSNPEEVISAKCVQATPVRWTCAVAFPDGGRATVVAIWYGQQRALGFSFAQ